MFRFVWFRLVSFQKERTLFRSDVMKVICDWKFVIVGIIIIMIRRNENIF